MAYLGKSLDYGTLAKQVLTTNGSTVVFALDHSVDSGRELFVSVGGVIQEPEVVYSASGTTLTFTTAPAAAHRTWVVFLGRELSDASFTSAVMTSAKFQNNSVTSDKINTMSASKLTGAMPAISGAGMTGISTDLSAQEENIALLGFKMATNENLATYELVDQVTDEYYDATGITAYNAVDAVDAVSAVAQLADHSSSNRTLTVNGSVTASTTQKKFGTHGLDAGGANDQLSVPASADWNFTSDWTCEGWFYRTGGGVGSYELMNFRSGSGGGGNGLRIFYESRKLKLNDNTIGLDAYLVSSTSNLDDAWHHIAVVRSGNSIKGYIDGSSDGTTLTASGNNTSTGTLHIVGDGDQGFTGYMDEMRISNTARYTSNFTPSTTEFTPDANTLLLIHVNAVDAVDAVAAVPNTGSSSSATVGGSNPSKYYSAVEENVTGSVDSYTKLLLHFDSSGLLTNSGNSVAAITKGSGLTQDTTNKVYGASSAANNASSSGIHVAYNADWGAWGSQDWTVDFRFRLNNLNDNQALMSGESDNQYFGMRYKSGYLNLNSNNTGWNDYAGTKTNYVIGQWYHVAVVNNGTSLRVYVDGVLDNDRTSSGATATGSRLSIFGDWGSTNTWHPNGNMDEFRLSLGIARWTSNFTPPTMAYPEDVTSYNATMDLVSTTTTALTAPATGSLVTLIENNLGTATLNTDIKGYVSRNGGTGWDQVTLADKGTWGTNKKILTGMDTTFSNSASGTDMKYKIETANQSYTAAAAGGYETGDRTASITVTHNNLTFTESQPGSNLVDGLNADQYQSGSRFVFANSGASAGAYIRFTHNTAKVYTEAKWYGCTSATGVWKWQGSNDGTTFTDIGGSFTLQSDSGWVSSVADTLMTMTSLNGNTTAYTIYQLTWVSGATYGGDYQADCQFKTAPVTETGKQTRVHATSLAWKA